MATVVRRARFVPDSPVAVSVAVVAVAGLMLGLVALCCCLGEPVAGHGPGRAAAAGLAAAPDTLAPDILAAGTLAPGTLSDVPVVGDPPDEDADGSGHGCGHPDGHPVAVVAPGGAVTRDLTAVVVPALRRPDVVVAGPAVAAGATAARAPASHLLCIMRT